MPSFAHALDRMLQRGEGVRVFATEVDVTTLGPDGTGSDGHRLEHRERVVLHDEPVDVRAGSPSSALQTTYFEDYPLLDDRAHLRPRWGNRRPRGPRSREFSTSATIDVRRQGEGPVEGPQARPG